MIQVRTALVALALCAAACGGGGGNADAKKDGASSAKPGADAKPAGEAKAATKPTKIEQVGLTAELPEGATVMKGMSDNSAMISTDAATLNVSLAKDTDPKTVDEGKSGAMLGDKGRGLTGEKIADGWIVTWENTGSMGDNYWLNMRREIGGKGYMCDTMQSNEAQRKAAIEICKSLKP
jgi:hypothetical protein